MRAEPVYGMPLVISQPTVAVSVPADPTYRRAAERLRGEIAALPGPERAVKLLQRLERERRPLLSV